MNRLLDILGQGMAYLVFAVLIGYFSASPAHHPLPAGSALIKLSISHPGQRVVPCRRRSAEEMRKLAMNMRAPLDCPRERHPVRVDLTIDGTPVFGRFARPSGLAKDGKSQFYEKFIVSAGRHSISVRMHDADLATSSGYAGAKDVHIGAGQVVIVGFDRTSKQVVIQ